MRHRVVMGEIFTFNQHASTVLPFTRREPFVYISTGVAKKHGSGFTLILCDRNFQKHI